MTQIDRQATYTGTKEVAAPLRFDTARLESYLAANAPGFKGPLTVRQFKGGQSNPTYMLETPARKYVLRRKPPGKLLPSAHAVDREFKVISALYAQGFPTAEPVIYCADESITGTAFYVMGYVEGRVIWVPDMPGSNPKERAAVFDAMNATLARLHSYEPSRSDLATTAAARITSPARSIAGRSSTAHPRPRRSTRWSASWNGCRGICRRPARCGSCTATTASTT